MEVKSYRAFYNAPRHPTRDHRKGVENRGERPRLGVCVLDNRLRSEPGVRITREERLKYNPIATGSQSTCCQRVYLVGSRPREEEPE